MKTRVVELTQPTLAEISNLLEDAAHLLSENDPFLGVIEDHRRLKDDDFHAWQILEDDNAVGYAFLHATLAAPALDVITLPNCASTKLFAELLAAAISTASRNVTLWTRGWQTTFVETRTKSLRLERTRHVLQLARRVSDVVHDHFAPPIKVRPATPSDFARIVEIDTTAFREHPERSLLSSEQLDARLAVADEQHEVLLVAEAGKSIAGFAWLRPYRNFETRTTATELAVLAVDPRFHKSGIGRALVRHAIHSTQTFYNTDELLLYVDADNAGALRVYFSQGFHDQHRDLVGFSSKAENQTVAPKITPKK